MIELGQTVGNYRVTAKLGEGGMGAVFLAEHPVIGRKAALKVIHPQHARNPEVVGRFVNEATAINRIGHQHIVEVTDFGRTDAGDFYFAMEYLEGEVLSDLIAREAPFAPARALAIAAQIADALAASHAHGVIHRDLKPDNIFVVPRGDEPTFVKVLDFGLAKLVNDDGVSPSQTRRGVVMGTPYYMSPEQCDGREALDERSDIYSLGVVLFEMLTGHLPFGGDGFGEVLMKQLTMPAPAARSLVPELPEELDVVLHRALAKEPEERFSSMEAFRAALLAPASHAATLPPATVRGDLSGRMKAARPMSRAEISRRQTVMHPLPLTTLGASVVSQVEDQRLERVPRHVGARVTFAAVALAGLALAAQLTYVKTRRGAGPAAARPNPLPVAITFGSDPSGATILGPNGSPLGMTPLSVRMAPTDRPVTFRFQKPGFEPKTMEAIPNVPSSLFAIMKAYSPPVGPPGPTAVVELDDPPAADARVAAAPRHRHARVSATVRAAAPDTDGVLAPSFDAPSSAE